MEYRLATYNSYYAGSSKLHIMKTVVRTVKFLSSRKQLIWYICLYKQFSPWLCVDMSGMLSSSRRTCCSVQAGWPSFSCCGNPCLEQSSILRGASVSSCDVQDAYQGGTVCSLFPCFLIHWHILFHYYCVRCTRSLFGTSPPESVS